MDVYFNTIINPTIKTKIMNYKIQQQLDQHFENLEFNPRLLDMEVDLDLTDIDLDVNIDELLKENQNDDR